MGTHPFVKLALIGDSLGCTEGDPLGLLAPFEPMLSCGPAYLFQELFTDATNDTGFTNTRATTQYVVTDTNALYPVPAGAIPIQNARPVQNMLASATEQPRSTLFYMIAYGLTDIEEFPLIDTSSGTNFSNAWYSCSSLTSFPLIDTSSGTNFSNAWRNCASLTSFPLIDTSSGTIFSNAWYNCSSLTSFPLIDTSSGTNFSYAWRNCASLTSFPLIDTSSGTNFSYAWYNCSSLTSFPLIDTSSGTNFLNAWYNCSSLTSFPLIDTSSGTNFSYAWYNCSSLTSVPASLFDSTPATDFTSAFVNCALSETSVDNILVSINAAGQSNGTLNITGGTSSPPSATGLAAKTALEARGWTVTVNS